MPNLSKPPKRSVRDLFVLILPMAAGAGGALYLGQDNSWDILNYHFYSGFAFLHKPLNYDFAPAQVQSFFNPLLHVFSYLMMAYLPSKLMAVILGSVQGLNFYLVFRISRSLVAKWPDPLRFWISLSCAAAGCYGATFITELGTTFGDSLISLLILSTLLLLIRCLQSDSDALRTPNIPPAVAGALLGLAVALKLAVAIYAVALTVAFAAFVLPSKRRVRPLLWFVGAMGISFLSFYGYWGWNLYHEYRNPVFPYMNAFIRSPFYDLRNVSDARFFPRTLLQTLFYPFFFAQKNTLVSELQIRDIRLACCYLSVVILAVVSVAGRFRRSSASGKTDREHSKSRILWFLVIFFIISYLAWQFQFSIYRYLIVLELLSPVFLALALERLIGRKGWVFSLSLVLNATLCLAVVPADFGRQEFDDSFLKVEYPPIGDLGKSVVLMGGGEPTSYIIPSAPARTRFIRVASNFVYPGRNKNLDGKILRMLEPYDGRHTFVYIANESEKEQVFAEASYYGVTADEQSCRPLHSVARKAGFLCATLDRDPPEGSP